MMCSKQSLPLLLGACAALVFFSRPREEALLARPKDELAVAVVDQELWLSCSAPMPTPFLGGNFSKRHGEEVLRKYWENMYTCRRVACYDGERAMNVQVLDNGRAFFAGDSKGMKGEIVNGKAWQEMPFLPVANKSWSGPTAEERRRKCNVSVDEDVLMFRTWFQETPFEYGHTLQDFLPQLLWLTQRYPSARPVVELGKKEVIRRFLAWFAPLVAERALFVWQGDVVCTSKRMFVPVPRFHPVHLVQTEYYRPFRRRVAQMSAGIVDKVVYYSRMLGKNSDISKGRLFSPEHQGQVLDAVRSAMAAFSRKEELVVFTGHRNNRTMTHAEQFALFSSASLAVGPHGTGLANQFWMPRGSVVIEFMCSVVAKDIGQCARPRAHYMRGLTEWLRAFHVFFTDESTELDNRVDLHGLSQALQHVWTPPFQPRY